jgi:hypothetical protein
VGERAAITTEGNKAYATVMLSCQPSEHAQHSRYMSSCVQQRWGHAALMNPRRKDMPVHVLVRCSPAAVHTMMIMQQLHGHKEYSRLLLAHHVGGGARG